MSFVFYLIVFGLPCEWVTILSGPLPIAWNKRCLLLCFFFLFVFKTKNWVLSSDSRSLEVCLSLEWISVDQTCVSIPPYIKLLSSSISPTFLLSQFQLLHSSVRVWEGAPDCSCVRVAQDVTAEPASADHCRSLWQREPGRSLSEPQQQQQLHQQQERDTVSLTMGTISLACRSTRVSVNDLQFYVCLLAFEFISL